MFVLIKMSHNTGTAYFTSNYCRVSVDAITADSLLVEWELGTGLKEREKSSFLTLNFDNLFHWISWHRWSTEGQWNTVGRWVYLCTRSSRWAAVGREQIWDQPSALFICRLHRLQTPCSTNIHKAQDTQCHGCEHTSITRSPIPFLISI